MKGPGGKYLFGIVKVGEKGQIVIPKEARELFHIQPGDSLFVVGDKKTGIAIIRNEELETFFTRIWNKGKEREGNEGDSNQGSDQEL